MKINLIKILPSSSQIINKLNFINFSHGTVVYWLRSYPHQVGEGGSI
ncbi:hypothetical protein LCGC14_1893620, partial [marine sediment metagenome]